MIRRPRQRARWGAVLVALGLLGGPAAAAEAAAPDESTQDEAEVVQLKVEIKLASGRVVRLPGDFKLDWGVDTAVEVEADGSTHQFSFLIARKGDPESGAVSITMSYGRDGEPIIAPYSFDTKVKRREVVRIEGGLAIALTVTPKKTGAPPPKQEEEEEPPPEEGGPPADEIEIDGDADDPLGGLE